ncbi:MAG: zinc ribbon domain-containing protein [Anaerolineae bacterium]|nr:zinc ribbon domain-containing protein [Anaerolineae bacterium]
MNCPSCGKENRPGARFCARCGALLTEIRPPQPQPVYRPERAGAGLPPAPSPVQDAASAVTPGTATSVGNISLLGGHGLLTIGGLIALFAFMLPWASCGNFQLSGLDIVTQSSQYAQYGADASWTILILVPLGALALMLIGLVGLAVNLFVKSLSLAVNRLLPLLAILFGLAACCPSCAFFASVQQARSDPSGLGTLIQVRHGFWFTLIGLALALVGVVIVFVTSLATRQARTPARNAPP